MLVFRGVQIRKLDRLLKAPDLKVSEVNCNHLMVGILMVGRWWKSRWLDYFKDPSCLAPAKKNPHHLIGIVFCRSGNHTSIILYQGDRSHTSRETKEEDDSDAVDSSSNYG